LNLPRTRAGISPPPLANHFCARPIFSGKVFFLKGAQFLCKLRCPFGFPAANEKFCRSDNRPRRDEFLWIRLLLKKHRRG
jgi:hypothetical protein